MIRKLFKLDEPLGRAGFILGSAVIFFTISILFSIFVVISPKWSFLIYLLLFLIVPLSAKRLKDLGRNRLFSLFLLMPVLFMLFIEGRDVIRPILQNFSMEYAKTVIYVIMTVSSVTNLICFFLFIYLVFSEGNIAAEKYAKKKSAMIIDRVFIWVCVFGFFAFLIGSCQYEIYQSKKAAMKVVEAVDKFQAEKGHYPEKMEELIPDYIAEIPKVEGGFIGKGLFYHLYKNDEDNSSEYCVGFIYMPIRHVTYCSKNRVWRDWD